MDETLPDREIVFETRRRKACLESRLVLEAAGIRCEMAHRASRWVLVVRRADLAAAAAELDAYRQENPEPAADRSTAVPLYAGAATAVLVYAGTLMLVATLSAREAFGLDWFAVGRMQAGNVMAGQWWRTVTALTLHLDAGHLLANLVFGSVFGLLAGHALGGGIAWLVIVLAGALGNLINAALQAPIHTSIGASTAVFAALGVIVSHALRPRAPVQEKRLRRWSPLIGGLLLLAFTGLGGERTDVTAHVTGGLAGLALGWLGCRLPDRCLANDRVQQAAGLAAIGILALAWIAAAAAAHSSLAL